MIDIKYYSSEMLPIVPLAEADFHGASFVFNLLYNKGFPAPITGKTLKHGWTPNRFIKYTRQVIHWGDKHDIHLCFNKFQENYLRSNGYKKSIFIGAPYAHAFKLVEPLRIPKISKSLLIMPQHTLKHIKADNYPETFFNQASEIIEQEKFRLVAVCIHRQSMDDRITSWAKKHNVQILIGASEFDSRSLINQAILFSHFSNVLTNSFGSHIPYSLYSNCKIKINNLYKHTKSELMRHPWYQEHPEVADIGLHNQENVSNLYPELFLDNWISNENLTNFLKEEIPTPPEILPPIFSSPIAPRWIARNLIKYLKFKSNIQEMLSQHN